MKKLLKISFDQALLSLTPILSWFLLSLIVDKDLINVFTITYPLQCIYGIIRAPFATGANISRVRDRNKNATMSGLTVGIVLSLLIYGVTLLNIDGYISFMNMNPAIYHTFSIYAVVILIIQTIFSFILDKLYFEDENSKANRYSTAFNLLNFIVVVGMALITKNQALIVSVTCAIMAIFTVFAVLKNSDKFRFRLNFLNCLKYDSANFISYVTSFFVFLFGLSNALEFGPQYGLAITFVSLVTDTQWDILDSISTLAKVDLAKRRFNYKQSLKNAYKLLALLLGSSLIMFFCLYRFYDLDLRLTLIYLGLEFTDFLACPAYYLRTCVLQLNWSSTKTALNKFFARLIRLACAFLPTPFCTNIGALSSTACQIITTHYFLSHNFSVAKSGRISKRRTKKSSAHYRYNDLPIDKN